MENSKSKAKKVLIIVTAVLLSLIFLLWVVFFFRFSPTVLSVDQHNGRISKLVDNAYMNDESIYSSYELYPIYNEKDKIAYCLIEFEPYGFEFVQLNNVGVLSLFGYGKSMYTRAGFADDVKSMSWTIGTQSRTFDSEKGVYLDENGKELTSYKRSPYKIARVDDGERLYLLNCETVSGNVSEFKVPAIKKDGKFVSVIC